jgi:hypothetical protein
MVSSRRANRAVRSSIRSEKDHGSMARVTLDSCVGCVSVCVWVGGGGGRPGPFDEYAKLRTDGEERQRFLICRGRNQCSGKQWESDRFFFKILPSIRFPL